MMRPAADTVTIQSHPVLSVAHAAIDAGFVFCQPLFVVQLFSSTLLTAFALFEQKMGNSLSAVQHGLDSFSDTLEGFSSQLGLDEWQPFQQGDSDGLAAKIDNLKGYQKATSKQQQQRKGVNGNGE